MFGKVISTLLKANGSLTALVASTNIYPYVINENVSFPAIVYTIDGIEPEYTKDGWTSDSLTFSVVSFSKNYSDLQDIATQVRAALELISGTTEGVTYWNILLTAQSEGFGIDDDIYFNKLTFETEITNYS